MTENEINTIVGGVVKVAAIGAATYLTAMFHVDPTTLILALLGVVASQTFEKITGTVTQAYMAGKKTDVEKAQVITTANGNGTH